MDEDALYNKVIAWTKHRSGLPIVIRDRQGSPRPPTPNYGMVNLISLDAIGLPQELEYAANLEPGAGTTAEPFLQIPVIEWESVFSFNVYGPGASDYARKVATAGSVLAGGEGLLPLTLFRASAIRRIPELVNQVWENRVQVDLVMRHLERDGVPVDIVETAEVDITNVLHDPDMTGQVTVTKPTP